MDRDLPAPVDVFRTVQADEVGQGMDRRQSLVARRDAAAAFLLESCRKARTRSAERSSTPSRSIGLRSAAGGEGQEQTQRVAVALLRVAGEVALADEVLQQEAPDPRAEQGVSVMVALLPGVALEAGARLPQQFGRHAEVDLGVGRWACPR